METLVLYRVTFKLPLYGNLLGEDDEESFVCRSEKLRLRQALCPLALNCVGSVSTPLVARKHHRQLAALALESCICFFV